MLEKSEHVSTYVFQERGVTSKVLLCSATGGHVTGISQIQNLDKDANQ